MAKREARRKADRLSADTARREFTEVIERVAYQDERIVVTRYGKELLALVSMDDYRKLEGAA